MNGTTPAEAAASRARAGLLYGLAAYGLWGIMPIYFKWLKAVPSIDIVAHRIVWSLVALAILATLAGAWDQVRAAIRHRRTLAFLFVTALLIGTNWMLYVYAINSGHILAGSLGYYLNPLANILLGRFILKERLTKLQWTAVAIAAVGIAVLAAGALGTLWISLTLCFSFATYGLLRKIIHVESLAGLTIETALLFPIALGWLLMGGTVGRPMFGSGGSETVLLVATGIVSTVPLLCFTAAARRLAYSTVGMLQFIAPTLQFLLAVAIYNEPFTNAHAIAFGCIWTALALYLGSMVRDRRARQQLECSELAEA
ncbi:EamA family transporter RarD [Sphingomonas sp. G124]|uniref:EamA family transporter RarD n=1 Tax=Sphingomonas cremea TaxID=2904799 RepID=A0A9X1QNE3_9SPHN|nr:EamA family transporter RarD [Sphingomonas cremea]MCF2515322.1 EamA family transporter RarD [Sphingomonas cremea]